MMLTKKKHPSVLDLDLISRDKDMRMSPSIGESMPDQLDGPKLTMTDIKAVLPERNTSGDMTDKVSQRVSPELKSQFEGNLMPGGDPSRTIVVKEKTRKKVLEVDMKKVE